MGSVFTQMPRNFFAHVYSCSHTVPGLAASSSNFRSSNASGETIGEDAQLKVERVKKSSVPKLARAIVFLIPIPFDAPEFPLKFFFAGVEPKFKGDTQRLRELNEH